MTPPADDPQPDEPRRGDPPRGMHVDLYERIWMWGVGGMLALFFGSTAYAALTKHAHPPSHVETINPRTALSDPRFRTQGVSVGASGRVTVTVVGLTFAWLPGEVTVPAATPVTFRVTSTDVMHGFQIIGTNGQTMVIPGYVSQFTTQFSPGEYLMACNEYCGVGHHTMVGRFRVVPASAWRRPASAAGAPSVATASRVSEHDHGTP